MSLDLRPSGDLRSSRWRMPPPTGPATPAPIAPISVKAQFPAKFRPLLEEHHRFKVYYGGRNGTKSWQFARALLIRGLKGGLRVLCTREVQSSLKESVKQLLADQIVLLGLQAYYRVLESEIRGPDGTLFMFKGLSDPEALKSAEGVDVCWIEEARILTAASWKKLEPTIRKPFAEIWISYNPELETDFVHQTFIIGKPPPDSLVIKVGYEDNPWISAAISQQIEHLKETDYDEYLWMYGGQCRISLDGAVYAHELRESVKAGRICKVPLERAKPVHTFWDLGRSDSTAIWFAQIVGFEHRILRAYDNTGFALDHYLAALERLREENGWFYGTHWLPHDADNKLLGHRRTIRQQMEDAHHRVRIAPKLPVVEGINAARTLFPSCYFDEVGCKRGVDALRHYHYEVRDDGSRAKQPFHDWSSHYADGFRYLGVALRDEPVKTKPKPRTAAKVVSGRSAWMR